AHAIHVLPFLHRVDGLEIDLHGLRVRLGRQHFGVQVFGLLLDGVRLGKKLVANLLLALREHSDRRYERNKESDVTGHAFVPFLGLEVPPVRASARTDARRVDATPGARWTVIRPRAHFRTSPSVQVSTAAKGLLSQRVTKRTAVVTRPISARDT